MQQLQQHCLELWTRRLSTPGAGRKDCFLAGYLPRCPGGGPRRAQRPRAVGMARPRPPPAVDVRLAPCRLCPVHLKPQCEHCRLARRGVAHCCVRGHEGHPVAVAGTAASSRALQVWLAPPEPPPEPPAKRPCVALVPAVADRCQRPDCRSPSPPARGGWVQSTLPWVPNAAPPLHGIQPAPRHGGGGDNRCGGEPQWLGTDGAGWAATPPPLPSTSSGTPGGSAALGGRTRGRAPNERRFFRDIAR